jgi:hypothetical protein
VRRRAGRDGGGHRPSVHGPTVRSAAVVRTRPPEEPQWYRRIRQGPRPGPRSTELRPYGAGALLDGGVLDGGVLDGAVLEGGVLDDGSRSGAGGTQWMTASAA